MKHLRIGVFAAAALLAVVGVARPAQADTVDIDFCEVFDAIVNNATLQLLVADDPTLAAFIDLLRPESVDINGNFFVDSTEEPLLLEITGNGMLDASNEFGVLQILLTNDGYDNGTVTNAAAVAAWNANAAQFQADLGTAYALLNAAAPELIQALVAYITIGDGEAIVVSKPTEENPDAPSIAFGTGSWGFVAGLFSLLGGVIGDALPGVSFAVDELDRSNYINLTVLASNGDADNDGQTNVCEYKTSIPAACPVAEGEGGKNGDPDYLVAVLDDSIFPAECPDTTVSIFDCTVPLTGDRMVPAVATSATGTWVFTAEQDTFTNTVSGQITVTHDVVDPGNVLIYAGASGEASETLLLDLGAATSPVNVSLIESQIIPLAVAGQFHLVVTSAGNPDGEIRGNQDECGQTSEGEGEGTIEGEGEGTIEGEGEGTIEGEGEGEGQVELVLIDICLINLDGSQVVPEFETEATGSGNASLYNNGFLSLFFSHNVDSPTSAALYAGAPGENGTLVATFASAESPVSELIFNTAIGFDILDGGEYYVEVVGAADTIRGAIDCVTNPLEATLVSPSLINAEVGDDVSIQVAAGGLVIGTVEYQWFFTAAAKGEGPVEIVGATDSTLLLEDVTEDDAGDYSCRVSDDINVAFSASATLQVGVITEGEGEGTVEGEGEGTVEGEGEGTVEGEGEGTVEGEGEGTVEGEGEGTVEGEGEGTVEGEGEGTSEGEEPFDHNADQNNDGRINLSELLRVIQLFNSPGYHCAIPADSTEDGFFPGVNAEQQACTPHTSDYNPQDWRITLSELLRLIQFYNSPGGYEACQSGEDGYCPVGLG